MSVVLSASMLLHWPELGIALVGAVALSGLAALAGVLTMTGAVER